MVNSSKNGESDHEIAAKRKKREESDARIRALEEAMNKEMNSLMERIVSEEESIRKLHDLIEKYKREIVNEKENQMKYETK